MKRITTQDQRSEGPNKKAKYHAHGTGKECCQARVTCDYCHKDITHTSRILCAVCVEFDLCIECFSAGVELRGHKFWHGYRVVEDLNFCFLSPDWSATEEQLLLEGLELYGIGNWFDVANYVYSKDVSQCKEHYERFYMNQPSWPDANFEHVRDSRLEASKPCKKSKSTVRRQRVQMSTKKHEPMPSAVFELSGYMPRRKEFEIEWDDACETKIMDIEFTDSDTDIEIELKLQMLEMYNRRLQKRHSIRELVVEKKLHDQVFQEQLEKSRTPQEEKVHREIKKFIQVMGVEEYNQFVKGLVRQQELEDRVRMLQQYRADGLTSLPVEETGSKTPNTPNTPSTSKAPVKPEKAPQAKKASNPLRSSNSAPRSPTVSLAAPVVASVTPPGSPDFSPRSVERRQERVTRSRALRTQEQRTSVSSYSSQYPTQYPPQYVEYDPTNVFAQNCAETIFAVSVI
eukprot:TRINITY_DN11815_c0_g1_i1.p1 TRINITY_DN11815_c0_g1~~TRINITY_DN11815_c0_g1_i1.p1  ORF type:complete len:457 (-),score=75.18 TRINITY_DN11815_c0_g1_i1:40-1410(-)